MLSGENQDLNEIFLYYDTTSKSLNNYRESIINNKIKDPNYVGLTKHELIEYFNIHLIELEKNVSFNILSNLEASFQIDYIIRTKKKYKDELSRKFRSLQKSKGDRVSLEQDILSIWKSEYPNFKAIVSDFVGSLKYRHWLAHGRYWKPKIGRKHDVPTIYTISNCIHTNLPLQKIT